MSWFINSTFKIKYYYTIFAQVHKVNTYKSTGKLDIRVSMHR